MGSVKVVNNNSEMVALLNSSEVCGELGRIAEDIRSKADSHGSGSYVADVQPGTKRAHARVSTDGTWVSYHSEAKHGTLLKSMGAARRGRA